MNKLFEIATGISSAWSLAAFAIVALVLLVVKFKGRKVPSVAWANFSLPAQCAHEQQVQFSASKDGFAATTEWPEARIFQQRSDCTARIEAKRKHIFHCDLLFATSYPKGSSLMWRKILCMALLVGTLAVPCLAEKGVLAVQVNDAKNHPIAGVLIKAEGASEPGKSDPNGLARIKLDDNIKVNAWIHVQILKSPPGRDLVLISPWDGTAQVPPFGDQTSNHVLVVLADRGDRMLLENGTALNAFAARINRANSPKPKAQDSEEQRREALATVAATFGLSADEVDKAIRAWGERATDPYEKGLAALYEKNYPLASKNFERSLEARGRELAKAQTATSDVAVFLGQSRYEEGKYSESASAYRTALDLNPTDAKTMGNLGLSLEREEHYQEAEPLLRRALAIDEKALGPDHPTVGIRLNNLATLLLDKGEYAEAEILCRRALTIAETTLGPDHPTVAMRLGNLAASLKAKGDYAGAEPLYRRALAIDEMVLGPDHPDVAGSLNNLAGFLYVKADYAGAEALYQRALAIDEKTLGRDHPTTQTVLFNLVVLIEIMRDKARKPQ